MNNLDILINMNLLFFVLSFTYAFTTILEDLFAFLSRFIRIEMIFSKILKRYGWKSRLGTKKEEYSIVPNIQFTIIFFIFSIVFIVYFFLFYSYITLNFCDNNIWNILQLCFTPFLFLVIPLFIPTTIFSFLIGYHPNELKNYIDNNAGFFYHKFGPIYYQRVYDWTIDKNQIENSKKEFWVNLIKILIFFIILTFFTSIGHTKSNIIFGVIDMSEPIISLGWINLYIGVLLLLIVGFILLRSAKE